MNLRLLSEVNRESLEIAKYYEAKQAGLGIAFIDKFEQACAKIERGHLRFPRLESIETARNIRRVLLKRFPYLLIYEVLPDEVLGLALRHVSQEPGKDIPGGDVAPRQ